MEYNIQQTVYAPETIEFVTIAVEYCIFIESFENLETHEFADKLCKILPLLYIKAFSLPEVKDDNIGLVQTPVTEEDYNFILERVTVAMGAYNDYLEVFVSDMQYSDAPILAHIAEDLSDIYQDIRNFVAVYQNGLEEHMNEALFNCADNFKNYWGQTLTNVLRALHAVKFQISHADFPKEERLYDTNFDDEW